ncbi:MAG: cation transporting ATPase C-terminal domain-containing protein [Chloroflexi bacterium]|nr:cation transporting ATPase C-terminal domain-containing protein [Chloroflexota bacterium]
MFAALNFRSTRLPLFRLGLLGNPHLLAAIAVALAVQVLPFYVPFLNDVFSVSPLSAGKWLSVVALASVAFWSVEIAKGVLLNRR